MFKNLDGFKKVKEDESVTVMQHPKGHQITIAMKSIPIVHRRQLMSLPLHKACGGAVKLAEGGPPDPRALPPPDEGAQAEIDRAEIKQEQEQRSDVGRAEMKALQDPQAADQAASDAPMASNGASGSWDAEEVPAAPAEAAASAAAPKQQSLLPEISPASAYNLGVAGIQETAKAQGQQAKEELAAQNTHLENLKMADERWEKTQTGMINQIKGALNAVANGKINPNHYMESMQAPQRVATGIGLLLGGLSSGLTGHANPAMEILNKQIDRDIDAQKAGLNNKMNIYHAYLDQFKNAAAAESMTRATELAITGQKIKIAALNSADPLIQARSKIALSQIQQSMVPLVLNAQLMAEGTRFSGASKGQSGSEAEYQTYLKNAQRLNPKLYEDAQSKYIPGVGTAEIPVHKEDINVLSTFKKMNELAKEGQDFAQSQGRTVWGTAANQKASDIMNSIQVQMSTLEGLNRLTHEEMGVFKDLVKHPGAWNQGAAIQSFKDLRHDIHGKTDALVNKYQIKPFGGRR